MKKIFFFAAAVAVSLSISAQKQMHIWVNGNAINLPISQVDSVTFTDSNASTPDDPNIPEPDPTPDPSTANGIGIFSVAEGKTVSFAPGNLQFNAVQGSHLRADGTTAKGTWRFAENQWDCVGVANENIAEDYDGWIDLFGWGTSGYDNTANDPNAIFYQPWSSSSQSLSTIKIDSTLNCDMYEITGECVWEYTFLDGTYNRYGYGPSQGMAAESLVGTSAYYDWGVYNAISNGGNEAGSWRSLTRTEWEYLLNTRKNAQFLRSHATVNGVYGYVLLPDDFKKPSDITWSHQTNDWTTNTYSAEQWSALEALGAVFLPAAGYRDGTNVGYVQNGGYWSATEYGSDFADCLYFYSKAARMDNYHRDGGFSVRLVKDFEEEQNNGTENGHEYVDLGLSVKWATCNVGASKREEYGDYFAWGETEPKSTYNLSTYKWCNGSSYTLTKYCTNSSYGTVDNKTQLELSDDAAAVNWGGSWRMPTDAELTELRENCTWTWTTQNGVYGYKVTSKSNGNSIFLPAAGYLNGDALYNAGSYGLYWSSSLSTDNPYSAWCVSSGSGYVNRGNDGRFIGLTVRPVCQ